MLGVERLYIQNFQSLADVDLELGPLTVLVGPSNSGKSAVLRAVRAAVHNVSRPDVIVRRGKTKATIALGPFNLSGFPEDAFVLVFERGKSLSRYTIKRANGDPLVYAKAGTTVPDDIAKIIRIAEVEGEDLNFALQHDRPFLLDAPATKVAKVLGDLTGINVLFEAVREANRRRLEVVSKLKVRRADVEELHERAAAYEDVGAQHERVRKAEDAYWEAARVNTRIEGLARLIDVVEKAEAVLAEMSELPPVPSLDAIDAKVEWMRGLITAASDLEKWLGEIDTAETNIGAFDYDIEQLERAYHEALEAEGVCPTCGQAVTAAT